MHTWGAYSFIAKFFVLFNLVCQVSETSVIRACPWRHAQESVLCIPVMMQGVSVCDISSSVATSVCVVFLPPPPTHHHCSLHSHLCSEFYVSTEVVGHNTVSRPPTLLPIAHMQVHLLTPVLHNLSLAYTLQIVPVCALLTPTVDNKFKKIAIGCLAAVMFVQVCHDIPC